MANLARGLALGYEMGADIGEGLDRRRRRRTMQEAARQFTPEQITGEQITYAPIEGAPEGLQIPEARFAPQTYGDQDWQAYEQELAERGLTAQRAPTTQYRVPYSGQMYESMEAATQPYQASRLASMYQSALSIGDREAANQYLAQMEDLRRYESAEARRLTEDARSERRWNEEESAINAREFSQQLDETLIARDIYGAVEMVNQRFPQTDITLEVGEDGNMQVVGDGQVLFEGDINRVTALIRQYVQSPTAVQDFMAAEQSQVAQQRQARMGELSDRLKAVNTEINTLRNLLADATDPAMREALENEIKGLVSDRSRLAEAMSDFIDLGPTSGDIQRERDQELVQNIMALMQVDGQIGAMPQDEYDAALAVLEQNNQEDLVRALQQRRQTEMRGLRREESRQRRIEGRRGTHDPEEFERLRGMMERPEAPRGLTSRVPFPGSGDVGGRGMDLPPEPQNIQMEQPAGLGPRSSVLDRVISPAAASADQPVDGSVLEDPRSAAAELRTPRTQVLSELFEELPDTEGVGDTVTTTPTAHFGVTRAALNAIGFEERNPDNLTEEQARQAMQQYGELLYDNFSENIPNFSTAPVKVQKALIDAGYNLGERVANFTGVTNAMREEDWATALKETFDTAQEGGRGILGIARRRAEQYNDWASLAGEPTVDTVRFRTVDGRVRVEYVDTDGDVIFHFTPRNGRHPQSTSNSLATRPVGAVTVGEPEPVNMRDGGLVRMAEGGSVGGVRAALGRGVDRAREWRQERQARLNEDAPGMLGRAGLTRGDMASAGRSISRMASQTTPPDIADMPYQPIGSSMDELISRRVEMPQLQQYRSGGKVKDYRRGGEVDGPGTSTSDSIPAMLSDGEYVINARAVDIVGEELLERINKLGLRSRSK